MLWENHEEEGSLEEQYEINLTLMQVILIHVYNSTSTADSR